MFKVIKWLFKKGIRRLISIIVSLVVMCVVVLLILNFTLFKAKNYEIDIVGEATEFSAEDVSASFEHKNSPIISLKKSKIKNAIESGVPYAKVINIEYSFPNKVVVHVKQRNRAFAFQEGENDYVLLDEKLNVLAKRANNADLIVVDGTYFDDKGQTRNVNVDDLKAFSYKDVFTYIYQIAKEKENYSTLQKITLERCFVKENDSYIYNLFVLDKDNCQYKIYDVKNLYQDKIYALMDCLQNEKNLGGYYMIFCDTNKKTHAIFVSSEEK